MNSNEKRRHDRASRGRARNQGFTLLELIVSLAIAAVVFGAAGTSLMALASGARETTLQYSLSDRVQKTRDVFSRDIQMVDAVRTDENGNPFIEIRSESGTNNVLWFRQVTGVMTDPGGNVEFVYGEPVVYRRDTSNRLLRVSGLEEEVLIDDVLALSFSISPAHIVSVSFTLEAGTGPDALREDIVFRFVPRNFQP